MANKNTKRNRKLNPTVRQQRKSQKAKVAAQSSATGQGPTIREQMDMLANYKK